MYPDFHLSQSPKDMFRFDYNSFSYFIDHYYHSYIIIPCIIIHVYIYIAILTHTHYSKLYTSNSHINKHCRPKCRKIIKNCNNKDNRYYTVITMAM